MEKIDEDRFKEAENLPPVKKPQLSKADKLTDDEFQKMLVKMQNPAEAQKELAVQVKNFLDQRIKEEMNVKGILSDHTRRWVEAYNSILEKLQKSLYGDKKVVIGVHKVSHSLIAKKIREAEEIPGGT